MESKAVAKRKVVLKRRYISDVVEVEEKPPPKPPKVHDTGVSEEVLSELSDAFDLLYDPNFLGHLPPDEQLEHFKKRDLLESKLYKTALKAFGSQRFVRERLAKDNGRKRVFIAQPLSELRGFDSFSAPSRLPSIGKSCAGGEANDGDSAPPAEGGVSAEELSRYRDWLQKRQRQHDDLERMGDVERYLRGKGELSASERRALRQIHESRRPQEVEKPPEEPPVARKRPTETVAVKRPSPLALFIIDSELKKRKLRLADLFTSIDKDKDWLLTREEFRAAMRRHRVPLPEPLLEDMVITLDQDNNNQLDYRELAQGLDQFRRERRSPEFLSLLSQQSEQFLLSQQSASASDSASPDGDERPPAPASEVGDKESGSLSPGEFDASPERYAHADAEESVELRRRDQVALRHAARSRRRPQPPATKTMIKTFDRDVDDHMAPSTLPERELADLVDDFRQRQLREFANIVRACKERGVVFSERLCRRVLLHPADRPSASIRRRLRPPGQQSQLPLEAVLAGRVGPKGEAPMPTFGAAQRRGVRGRRAATLAKGGRGLPSKSDLLLDDEDAEQELVTGAAVVRPKVDCWLTFEEFERLTADIDYSKQAALRAPNPSAFWPGRWERRVRLFLENDSAFGSDVFFQRTAPARPRRSHAQLPRENWPINDGRVTYGTIDPMLAHEITRPAKAKISA